ncbi:MAG: lytic transglycosylase domain-containing protein [Bacteroidales bacterium]|jgi:hypothetical protein|nr:lytic transglycosylase domain-containing protein [Bacteroidales bacterium]
MKSKIILLPLSIILIFVICFFLFTGTTSENNHDSSEKNNEADFSANYHLTNPPIPDTLQFAGENIPLEYYDVREALDRELLVNVYWQSNILLYCKRAYRYFPVIEPILAEEGIPDDFKYLALIESGLTNVISPAKAAGFWQFLKETGIHYGLEINEEVDERYHLEKATKAACQYLKKSYSQHHSWIMAAVAYNMGDNGVKRNIEKQQTSSYWDLLLNEESSRYIYRILAAKLILSHPPNYGIHLRNTDLYQPFRVNTLKIDSTILDLVDFAIQQDVSYKQLKAFNPWLRSDKLTNKTKKEYIIALPADKR